jgi:hypothetical protein
MKKNLTHLVVLIGISTLSSCALWHHIMGVVPAEIECEDKRLFVVPFAEETRQQSYRYTESIMGNTIAKRMTSHIVHSARVRMAKANPEIFSSVKDAFAEPKWGQICKDNKLDMIVYGTITYLQTKNRRDVGMLQGKISVKMTVVDKDDNIVFPEEEFTVIFPEGRSKDKAFQLGGVSNTQITEKEVRTQLGYRISQKLAQLFYDHDQ